LFAEQTATICSRSEQRPPENEYLTMMNETTWAVLQILSGLVALVAGGELLVRGASRLAVAMRISPLVIGLTVVAFGTSAPELAVSLQASLAGNADISLGNVVGSNIFNVLFILGISALIVPLVISSRLIRWDVPLMIGVSLLVPAMGWDGSINRLDGLLLFGGLVWYTYWCVSASRKESPDVMSQFAQETPAPPQGRAQVMKQVGLIVAGLLTLGLGSRWLVAGAVTVAEGMGVSQLIIGLTIVAAGTSLPELVTSIVAASRGERDIAVGNVVGSNIFNILGVLGLAGLVGPLGVGVSPVALRFDIPVMIAVAVACLPIFFTGYRIARWEGGLFLAYYLAYTAYLVLDANGSPSSRTLAGVIIVFVLPLTAITLVVASIRSHQQQRLAPPPARQTSKAGGR
jgi:cation:H+ antiporter